MKSFGQIAYEAYFEFSKGKSLISGAPLPTFGMQSDDVQAAWESAAKAVFNAVKDRQLQWWFDQREAAVIDELATKLGLDRQGVLRQALRTYQLVAEGHSDLVERNPQPLKAATPVDRV